MIDIYLITGFLGAGKTTLMKNLLNGFKNNRTAIIVNEFGKEGVDGELLRKEGMLIDEINNGSIFCTCRSDRFIDALLQARKLNVDYVLVEGSGLADPFGMPEILSILETLSPHSFHYSGSICVVDAKNFHKVYETAVAIKQQIQGADLILINKIDTIGSKDVGNLETKIRELNLHSEIIKTTFSKIDDFQKIYGLKWRNPDMSGFLIKKTMGISKYTLRFQSVDINELKEWLVEWAGLVYRVKGFCKIKDLNYLIECVNDQVQIDEVEIDKRDNFLVVLGPANDDIKNKIKLAWLKRFSSELDIS